MAIIVRLDLHDPAAGGQTGLSGHEDAARAEHAQNSIGWEVEMHLCSGLDTEFDDFGKHIFRSTHIPLRFEPTDGRNCPVCRHMRLVGAIGDDAVSSFRLQLMLSELINPPIHPTGIYPHNPFRCGGG